MNEIEIYETLKEFSIYVGDLGTPLKARISKLIPSNENEPLVYFWFISHHYKPEEDSMGVYKPGNTFGHSIVEVEKSLFNYINNFSGIGVEKNNFF